MFKTKLLVPATLLFLLATSASAQPTLSKVFSPNTIGPGSGSTVTFTLTNGSGAPVTDLAFSDTLPAAVTLADPVKITTDCDLGPAGSIMAPDGGSTVTVSDVRLEAASTCTIQVDVTSSTPGAHTNPAVTLTSSAGSSMSLPIDLTVVTTLPGFSKAFSPSTVAVGSRSTLTFTIDNTLNASRVGNLSFTDNLPAGMVVADPPNASTDCISASAPDTTLTADSGTGIIDLDADGSTFFPGFEVLPIGATCTVTVDVVATGTGVLDNRTTNLLADFISAGHAGDTLEVTVTPLTLTKNFLEDPVEPGRTVDLEFMVTNFNRLFSATGVSFSDDFSTMAPPLPGLTASSLVSNDCGGSVSGIGTGSIGLSGGTIAPEASCTVRVSLAVPPGATPGSYTNTTTVVSATVDGSPVVGNMATDTLFVEPTPILTVEILEAGTLAPDPIIDAGDDFVLRYTITNPSTTSGATDLTFLDELTFGGPMTGFLPFPLSVVLPPEPCGTGSTLGFEFPDIERQGLRLTGGSLAASPGAGASCTYDVVVTTPPDLSPGLYLNQTGSIAATIDGATRIGNPASDTIEVLGAPALTMTFADDPVAPGSTVTVEYHLVQPAEAPASATDITFSHDLSAILAGLTANLPASPDPPCGVGSSLVGSAGDTLLTLMSGALAPGESCTISVTLNVPVGAAPGSFPSTTSGVSSTVGRTTTSPPGTDILEVAGLAFSKEFLGGSAIPGDFVTLRFTIENIHPTADATLTFFTDTLSAALPGLSAFGGATTNTCGGDLSGTTALTYVGGSVPSSTSCTIEVDLLVPASADDGSYLNITSSLIATQSGGAVVIAPATDELVVNSSLLQLTKQFTDDPTPPGDSVTIDYILTNLDGLQAASGVAFTDDLSAALPGLTFDSVLFDDCAGTTSGAGTGMLDLSGVSLPGAGSCTLRISATVPPAASAGIYPSPTGEVSGMIGGFPVNGNAANDDLEVVQLLLFSKSFDGPTTATGTATLTFTITNPGDTTAIGISFIDDLDAALSGLIATSLPAVPCGAESSITGISSLNLVGGELPPAGGMCSFDVEVLVPATAMAGSYPNTTSELFQSGLPVADPATADLVIEPPPTFSKLFAPNQIGLGGISTLTFTIDNSASSVAASDLAFTDSLPAGMTVVTPANNSNGCGGTLTAGAGTSSISLAAGGIAAASSCSVTVDVTATVLGSLVNTTGDLTSSSGNSGTATDTLDVTDSVPPTVTSIDTSEGELASCSTVRKPLSTLVVTIEDDATTILNADDPSSYQLLSAGPNGDFQTLSCGPPSSDDIAVTIADASVVNLSGTEIEATLEVSDVGGLEPGLYRLLVCDAITDSGGNALDGDENSSAGGDFLVPFFRADPGNLLSNGNFDDCPASLEPWIVSTSAPNVVQPGVAGIDDSESSPLSAAAQFTHSAAGTSVLGQCIEIEGDGPFTQRSEARFTSLSSAVGVFLQVCEFFPAAACSGQSLGTSSVTSLLEDEGGDYVSFARPLSVPAGSTSALCAYGIEAAGTPADLDLLLDGLFVGPDQGLFMDGFESGNTSAWSAATN